MMFPKPISYKDKKYIKYIESLPCVVGMDCYGDIVAHHVEAGGVGMKCSDYRTISTCQNHHTPGDESIHKLGVSRFEDKHRLDLKAIMIVNLERYIAM
jgi:hypothetical protein